MASPPPVLLRDAALADGERDTLRLGVSILIRDGRIIKIAPDGEVDPGDAAVIDAGGATVIAGMVDCHSHLTMPGGSHWIARGDDPPAVLREVAALRRYLDEVPVA